MVNQTKIGNLLLRRLASTPRLLSCSTRLRSAGRSTATDGISLKVVSAPLNQIFSC